MSEGHSEDEERDIDFEDITDDEEVELNLPREGAVERDPPGEDVRDLPTATASGASVTKQEELYRLEPPNGARPKWNRPGRPLPVIEEPRGYGRFRDEWGRDESSGPKVATASTGPTECGGSDTPKIEGR